MSDRILVAVAWPYANGPRHVGHVAGFGVPSDIFARYHRLAGNRVLMVSGTDDHGTPIMVQADREGLTAEQLADRYNPIIAEDLLNLGLSYDLFTRTKTSNHYRVTQDLFTQMIATGAVYKATMTGTFSSLTGKALPDRYVEGTCPICGYGEARGDQCDNCGNQLDPADLIDPRSKIDGSPPVFRPTEHFFLDLPRFRDRLAQWIESQTHWRQNVRAFSLNLLKDVPPRPITRDLDLGRADPSAGLRRQADLRLVRRRDRLPFGKHRVGYYPWHARRLAGLVARPGRAWLLFHGQGQHRFSLRDLAGDADGLRERPADRRRNGTSKAELEKKLLLGQFTAIRCAQAALG